MINFEDFWQLLYEHGSRNYYKNATLERWNELSAEQQQTLYERIKEKIRTGKFVDYNPLEAIHDNLQRTCRPLAEPTNYNGSYKYLKEVQVTPLVSAPYKGVFGIYSLAEAQEFHLEIKRAINFNLREYMEQKAINPDYKPPIVNRD